jgi:hypothetical protein
MPSVCAVVVPATVSRELQRRWGVSDDARDFASLVCRTRSQCRTWHNSMTLVHLRSDEGLPTLAAFYHDWFEECWKNAKFPGRQVEDDR